MPKITSGVDIWLIVELLVRKSSFSQWKIWVQFLALAPNSKFLVTEILGGSQVVGKAVRFLSIMWETWTGFLASGLSGGPVPAVLDMWRVNQMTGALLVEVTAAATRRQYQDCACPESCARCAWLWCKVD